MLSKNKLVDSLIIEFSDDTQLEWEKYKTNYPTLQIYKEWLHHPRIFYKLEIKI